MLDRVLVSLLAFISYGWLLVIVLRHGSRGNRPSQVFALYLFNTVLVQIVYLMLSLATNTEEASLWYTFMIPVSFTQSTICFFFIRIVLGLARPRRLVMGSAWIGLLIIVLCMAFSQPLIYTNIYQDESTGLFVPKFGPLAPVLATPILWFWGLAARDLIRGYRGARSSLQHVRIQYLWLALSIAWIGMIANASPAMRPYPIDVAANVVSAFLIAYAILRYQLLDINLVVRQGLPFSITAATMGAGYFVIFYLAMRFFDISASLHIFFLSLAVALIAAWAARPLRNNAQRWIDQVFFRDKYDNSLMVQRLSRTATSVLDLKGLTTMILDDITETMHIQWAALFLERDASRDLHLIAQKGLDSDIRLNMWHSIRRWLSSQDKAMTIDVLNELFEHPALETQEVEELKRMEVELFVLLRARGELIGCLAIGPKLSRQGYSQSDELILTTLANQTAVAIDNARLYRAVQQELAERKRAEEALRFTQFTVDRSAEATFWMGPDAQFIYVNDAACRNLGYSREELLTMTVYDIDPDFSPHIWSEHWRDIKERGSFIFESRHRTRDGRIFPVEIMVNFLEFEGQEYNCAFVRDITDRKQMEEMMLQSAKMASVGRLAAGVAHEINNPLGVMAQSAQMLQLIFDVNHPRTRERLCTYGVPPEGLAYYLEERGLTEYLVGIRDAGQRAARIVSDLLGFSRRTSPHIASHDLNALIEQALSLAATEYNLRKQYDFGNIEIVRELALDLPSVACDGQQIQQVVLNLVHNATQAMITVQREGYRPRLTLRTMSQDEWVRFEIENNGPEIPEDIRNRLFEPFFTTKEVGEGTGLGLWLCWSIVVERHKGKIRVEQSHKNGTCFVVELPLQ